MIIAIPATRCAELRRKWACDVALEVRDAIRHLGVAHALYSHGSDVHYRAIGTLVPVTWTLVGIYDQDASLADIADDVMTVTEREPIH